ncbi:hypothetical protein Vadar_006195 [Vaccinium darrowii]|uniref:Uncharacterized protein n=1 Tax=Vaccinium darrowii TaxID=229202 RepID=A0ACB7YBY0_9ERIC|nr:hypothetical protein Vadar_006195 [Vaccinium darrowii]
MYHFFIHGLNTSITSSGSHRFRESRNATARRTVSRGKLTARVSSRGLIVRIMTSRGRGSLTWGRREAIRVYGFGFMVSGFSVRATVVSVTLDLVSPPPLVEAWRRSLPP